MVNSSRYGTSNWWRHTDRFCEYSVTQRSFKIAGLIPAVLCLRRYRVTLLLPHAAIIVAQFPLFRYAMLSEVVFGLRCYANLHLPRVPEAPVRPPGLLVGRRCAVESDQNDLE